MAGTATPAITKPRGDAGSPSGLGVSAFENVTSLVLALLILVAGGVVVLFALWLGNRMFTSVEAVPVVLADVGGGREDGVVGESMQLDAPDAEEIIRETDLAPPQAPTALALVTEALAAHEAELDDPQLADTLEGGAQGKLTGDGRQVAYGHGPGEPGVPRWKRWEVYFADGSTLEEYARQLDYFKIELGVTAPGNQVEYAAGLSQPTPARRTGPRDAEKRLWMAWRQGSLKAADAELMRRAGIDVGGRVILQFYPPELENRLVQLEGAFAGRTQGQIRKTRFGIKSEGQTYTFYVIEQFPL
ncbi:MAG: hypothetical protein K2Y37_23060 [Pirellulales bacterium]|nr:hypothetical protein [Pirellulales bacterium]